MKKIYIDHVNLIAFSTFALVVPVVIFYLTSVKYNIDAFSVILSSKTFYAFAYIIFTYICFSFLSFKKPKSYESLFIVIAFGGFFFIFSFLTILFQTDSVLREHVVAKNEQQLEEWLKTDKLEHTLIINGWDNKIVKYVEDDYVIEAGFLYKQFLVDKEIFDKNVTCNFENYKRLIDENSIQKTTCAFPVYKMIVDIST